MYIKPGYYSVTKKSIVYSFPDDREHYYYKDQLYYKACKFDPKLILYPTESTCLHGLEFRKEVAVCSQHVCVEVLKSTVQNCDLVCRELRIFQCNERDIYNDEQTTHT